MKKDIYIPTEIQDLGFESHGYKFEKFSYLVGRMMTMVEALGLPEKQEEAYMSIVKQELWKFWEIPNYIYSYDKEGNLK